ncbi:hypothetical protein DB30_02485 [Enhygromyxa salina]|uniref:Outer membrane protein beta-barrel domain-containing protein n=1 Tax=Enhygromyxa salina TaxID=215803 RepID=A0A0C2DDY8_9BACT|nr:hypothetical protein [Enhygromyxa salina]KIG17862.1 hypothetical protein DB30_02485 [Enhygromyxa salina]
MRGCVRPLTLAACLLAFPSLAQAAPSISKERIGPVPTESNLSHDEALRVLVEGEKLLETELIAEGLAKMLEAYVALELSDGAEARGVKELRSWLVKALEAVGLQDEANTLRARGSYVEHPLSVMPSTWFPASASGSTDQMGIQDAEQAVKQGLDLLQAGNIDGLGLLLLANEILERELGLEAGDTKEVRSFLVGLLETGGFQDEANALRQRGSVNEATAEDREVYAATWLRVIEAAGSADSVLGTGGLSGSSIKDTSSSSPSASDTSTSQGITEPEPDSGNDNDDSKSKVVQSGSVVPSVLIDLGIGTFQPEYGRKGLIWNAGLELHWTLFSAKFFSMQLGGGGNFGRNRDKRWLANAHGELRLDFDFDKVYLTPEFGGGYDQIAGTKLSIAEAYHVAPAAYYHFGGTLGVRFSDNFGMYGRAVRLNRDDPRMRNETRVRGGFLLQLEQATIDLAFTFTDYDARRDDPGARIYSGNLGFRF